MTNRDLFQEIVKRSGLKMGYLAEKMGMTHQTLLNKLQNKTEFTVYEAQVFMDVTGCSAEERDAVFYAQEGTGGHKDE